MEFSSGCLSRRSSPYASSSSAATLPPPASPIAATPGMPFPWGHDRHAGCYPNADNLWQTFPFPNSSYYSAGALQYDFSGLSLLDGKSKSLPRPPYNVDAASSGGLDPRTVERMKELYARSIVYSDGDRSAMPRILGDQGTDPYLLGRQSVGLHASSSSCSGNLMSRDLFDRGYAMLGAQTANGMLHGYDSPNFQPWQQQQSFFNYGMKNRRNSCPKLEIDASSVDLRLLRGRLVSWAKDHYDCRILNAKIQDAKEEEIEMVLDEVIDDAYELMMHPYGTSFMQKLIEVCSEGKRSRLFLAIMKDRHQFIRICCSNGSRCIQSLLEKLKSPQLITKFMSVIRPGVVDLIIDSNGYHVIKCCLHFFSAQQNKYILSAVLDNCVDLATDTYGCRVIYQCFDNSEGEEKEQLLSKIIEHALQLANDCYGNYVVQYVLDLKNTEINSKIRKTLSGNFISLSYNKFGSHVVEKLLAGNDIYQSSCIINELLSCPDLLVDPFGNYVMKTALSVAQGDTLRALFDVIKKREPSLLKNQYGRKVIESYKRRKATAYKDKVLTGFELRAKDSLRDIIPECLSTQDSYLDGWNLANVVTPSLVD